MYVADCLQVNEAGHLTIGGCDAVGLAQTYGTPLYVMDEETIRGKLRAFKASIEDMYENGGLVCYASKACSFKEMYRIVMQEGCGADVVSGGEMYTALQAGFPAERLYFHGNNKTEAELRMALSAGSAGLWWTMPPSWKGWRRWRCRRGKRRRSICGSPPAWRRIPTPSSAPDRSIRNSALRWRTGTRCAR